MDATASEIALRHENTLLLGQTRILEMIATAAPLADTLEALVRFIEAQEDGLRCGILVVASDGRHFQRGSGPNLPEAYHRALDGVPITPPYLGPCGQAAHQDTAVVAPDIARDTRWSAAWRDLALSCGLAACRSIPVHASDGRVLASLALYHDRPRDPHPSHPGLIAIATRLAGIALERAQTEAGRRDNERQARDLLDALPCAVYTTDAAGRITYYNQAAIDLSGRRPTLGSDQWCITWRLWRPDGTSLPHDSCPMAVALQENRAIHGAELIAERPDGARTSVLAYPTPLRDAAGVLTGAVNTLVDITERKSAEEKRLLLINELNHRVKNTLSTVQAIAAQTLGGTRESDKAREAFEDRLVALSKTHDKLTRNDWRGASLRDLLEAELAPHCGAAFERCAIEGPEVRLPPKIAVTLGMAFHELATNAAKYGALSRVTGEVRVAWDIAGSATEPRLRLTWTERNGPRVETPRRKGFGSRLIERGLSHELRGDVRMDYAAEGVVCTIAIPLPAQTHHDSGP